MTAAILQFVSRRVKCAHCMRWFFRAQGGSEEPYCSYQCGVNAQPDYCASGWAFTSTPGDVK